MQLPGPIFQHSVAITQAGCQEGERGENKIGTDNMSNGWYNTTIESTRADTPCPRDSCLLEILPIDGQSPHNGTNGANLKIARPPIRQRDSPLRLGIEPFAMGTPTAAREFAATETR
jgi:hypothetical protein